MIFCALLRPNSTIQILYLSLAFNIYHTFLRRSGGIAFCFKEHLAKFVKHLDSNSDYIMWIQIDKCLMKADENIILGLTYIPPIQSKYYNDEEILNLGREITSVCSKNKYVIITGDLNARTAMLKDYTRVDNFFSDIFDFE